MKYFYYYGIVTVKQAVSILSMPNKQQAPPGAVGQLPCSGVWRADDGLVHPARIAKTLTLPKNSMLIALTLINFFEISEEQARLLDPKVVKDA